MIHREVLAACLAKTNMGLEQPDVFTISQAMKIAQKGNLQAAVDAITGELGQSEIFLEEAKGFMAMMAGKSDDELFKMWDHRPTLVYHCNLNINID